MDVLCHLELISNNILDTAQYRKVIGWLEGVVIRFYKIEDRAGLNEIASDTWLASYQQARANQCSYRS